jgi:flagellar operon protein (TIGR03826 family)
MDNIRNCPQCGKIFAYLGRNLCPACIEKEEEDYKVVRRYVREHPGASINEVAAATEVEEEKILAFLRDGRLHSKGIKIDLTCERCGKIITTGRYCAQCLNVLGSELQQVLKTGSQPSNSKDNELKEGMHIKNVKNKKR